MIFAATPYCPRNGGNPKFEGRDYGWALNQFMDRLGDEDWAILIDHDCLWTYRFWYWQIEKAVERYPEAGFFTTMRFPAFTLWAIPEELRHEDCQDLEFHRRLGVEIARRYEGQIKDVTEWESLDGGTPNAGIFIMSKKVWKETGGFKPGWRQIDYKMHRKVRDLGYRAYLLKDVYLFHPKGLWFEKS